MCDQLKGYQDKDITPLSHVGKTIYFTENTKTRYNNEYSLLLHSSRIL